MPPLLLQEFSLSTPGLFFTQISSVSGFNISSGGEQVAAHLRAGLLEGRWSGVMPGKNRLARELRVSGEKMEAHGIRTGPYDLPDWEDNREGFHRLLDQLYGMNRRQSFTKAVFVDGGTVGPASGG